MASLVRFKAVLFIVTIALLHADAVAQTPPSRAAGATMCACPGRHKPMGNAATCEIACYGSGSSVGGGMSPQEQLMLGVFQGLINSYSQEQQAQRLAEERARQEAWRLQLERMRAEEERRKEEMKARLLAMLKGIGPAPELKFKLDSAGPAPVAGAPAAGLQFRLGDSAPANRLGDLPPTSPMAQLTRAAFYSTQAAGATSPEDAAAFADAAFNAAMGVNVEIVVPAETAALGVHDADVPRIESVRKRYQDASGRLYDSAAKEAQIQQQRQLAERIAADARARRAEAEHLRRQQALEEATRAADEAQALVEAITRQLAAEQDQARAAAQEVENSARLSIGLMDELRKIRGWGALPERGQESDAYLMGLQDATSCVSQNAGLRCRDSSDVCRQNYLTGYRVGEQAKEAKLRRANVLGQQAKATENRLVPLNHPEASGPCFYVWREAFNSGLRGWPFTMMGR